jgi:hypothetical protein
MGSLTSTKEVAKSEIGNFMCEWGHLQVAGVTDKVQWSQSTFAGYLVTGIEGW